MSSEESGWTSRGGDIDIEGEIETIVYRDAETLKNHLQKINQISILHLNIRSIRQNFTELLLLLESLRNNENCIDIIILTETFQIENIDQFTIEGYQLTYNNAQFNKNDGSIIYIKNNITHNNVITRLTQVKITQTRFQIKNTNYSICSLYRPPSTNTDIFDIDLESFLQKNKNADIKILIGDIDIYKTGKYYYKLH